MADVSIRLDLRIGPGSQYKLNNEKRLLWPSRTASNTTVPLSREQSL